MGNILLIGIVACVVWYIVSLWQEKPKASAIVPVPKTAATEPAKTSKPRWHKYDILLELQDCLRDAGTDEKKVAEICASISPLLLGDKKDG